MTEPTPLVSLDLSLADYAGDPVTEAVDAVADRLPPRTAMALQLVLDEIMTNLRTHGAQNGASRVAIRAHADAAEIAGTVEDDGALFDPRHAPSADTLGGLDDRPIGGLGLHMVRTITATLDYERVGGTNRLSFTLPIDNELTHD